MVGLQCVWEVRRMYGMNPTLLEDVFEDLTVIGGPTAQW